ncbi:manganese efflux pump [Thiospirochaeta perfilievii]|uniref:Putative manganese efflux pump MntP n=1 Tax=Thiospirochaeta perfilievii TaxID=252967 RepID=A0A5C1Q9Z3_9SPIO|nr:manganese efflux pump MntP family protein [Thiospirochaeta perfilievii]QEN04287.1 manganese efflux pump [Thiospirochaeta perfilievii]
MSSLEIILIGIILALDAFAVSISCGLSKKEVTLKEKLKVSFFFGGFQAIMPIIGYYVGNILPFNIDSLDHWIAFSLLTLIGIHMIKESVDSTKQCKINMFRTKTLLLAAIATSIDALAAGFSIYLLDANIELLIISTGLITFVLSYLGVQLGKRLGHISGIKVDLYSGVILILIGIKIVIEHSFG